ncbi:MAG: BBE domain-containing protein [Acidimicrobiales bacterium]
MGHRRHLPQRTGVEDASLADVRRAYRADDFARLRQLKTTYDPDNTFRVNFNIPPDNLSAERSSR